MVQAPELVPDGGRSVPPDIRRFDDWPPFVDLGSMKGSEPIGCLERGRRHLLTEFGKPLPNSFVG
jgi:hypothetical protein